MDPLNDNRDFGPEAIAKALSENYRGTDGRPVAYGIRAVTSSREARDNLTPGDTLKAPSHGGGRPATVYSAQRAKSAAAAKEKSAAAKAAKAAQAATLAELADKSSAAAVLGSLQHAEPEDNESDLDEHGRRSSNSDESSGDDGSDDDASEAEGRDHDETPKGAQYQVSLDKRTAASAAATDSTADSVLDSPAKCTRSRTSSARADLPRQQPRVPPTYPRQLDGKDVGTSDDIAWRLKSPKTASVLAKQAKQKQPTIDHQPMIERIQTGFKMVETEVAVFYTQWSELTQQQRQDTLESIRDGVATVLMSLQMEFTEQTKPTYSDKRRAAGRRHSEQNHRMSVIKGILVCVFASEEGGNRDFLELGAFTVGAGCDSQCAPTSHWSD
jgi:hypothetical protein